MMMSLLLARLHATTANNLNRAVTNNATVSVTITNAIAITPISADIAVANVNIIRATFLHDAACY